MHEEQEDMNVREDEIIDDPCGDVDGMIDLLIADDPIPKIKDSNEELANLVEAPKPRKIGPVLQEPPIPPDVDTSKAVVNLNLRRSAALDKFVGSPIENDSLVAVIRDNKPTTTVLNAVMEEIAEEAAHIKAWRSANWNFDKDLSEATFKRIKMLKQLVETISEKEKLRRESKIGKVDFHGEAFQRVLKYFLESILATFKEVGIPIQYEDIFFTQLAKKFDGFEKNAEKIYYGKDK
jgi:hypothetical protein